MRRKLKYTLEEMCALLKEQGTPYTVEDGQVMMEGKAMPLESPVIKLDRRNKKLVRQLQAKLEEYKGRFFGRQEKARPFAAPETVEHHHSYYKRLILQTLLEKGKVVAWSLSREIEKKRGVLFPKDFTSASFVIESYITGDSTGITGSTGLPDVSGD